MFSNLSLPLLLAIFFGAGGVIWFAGIRLSNTTDVLSVRFRLGETLGGVILLAVAIKLTCICPGMLDRWALPITLA